MSIDLTRSSVSLENMKPGGKPPVSNSTIRVIVTSPTVQRSTASLKGILQFILFSPASSHPMGRQVRLG